MESVIKHIGQISQFQMGNSEACFVADWAKHCGAACLAAGRVRDMIWMRKKEIGDESRQKKRQRDKETAQEGKRREKKEKREREKKEEREKRRRDMRKRRDLAKVEVICIPHIILQEPKKYVKPRRLN